MRFKGDRIADYQAACTQKQEIIDSQAQRIATLEAENAELRERCTCDPWWWAYTEYLDEGWCGPFETREQAEQNACENVGDDDWQDTDISYRQARNPEGCAEIERLEAENARLREDGERLDWLEEQRAEPGWIGVEEDEKWIVSLEGHSPFVIGAGPTLREAIDAARKEG